MNHDISMAIACCIWVGRLVELDGVHSLREARTTRSSDTRALSLISLRVQRSGWIDGCIGDPEGY